MKWIQIKTCTRKNNVPQRKATIHIPPKQGKQSRNYRMQKPQSLWSETHEGGNNDEIE